MQSLSRPWLQQCSRRFSLTGLATTRTLPSPRRRFQHTSSHPSPSPSLPSASSKPQRLNSWLAYPTSVLLLAGAVFAAYENYQPFRHTVLAVARCSRIAGEFNTIFVGFHAWLLNVYGAEAAVLGAIDYKKTLGKTYATKDEHAKALSQCHRRSAERVLKALLANGGAFLYLESHFTSTENCTKVSSSSSGSTWHQCEYFKPKLSASPQSRW